MNEATEKRGPGRPRAHVETRVEAVQVERQRRRGGGLDMGSQMKMGLPSSWYEDGGVLDSKLWVSRWVNDEDNRIFFLNQKDDYDFVELPEGSEAAMLGYLVDGRSTGRRISLPSGTKKDGSELRSYLMRKPKEFWEEDQSRMLRETARVERARVIEGATGDEGVERVYTPRGNSLKRESVSLSEYQP